MMIQPPAVTVLTTVYNRAGLIGPAIQSIMNQDFEDWEMVVVDDGSTDGTSDVVEAGADSRVRLIRGAINQGIPAGRNRALQAARGRYVAWLDSDDLARPNRLRRQFDTLECRPDIAMIGSCAGKIREDGSRRSGVRVPPLRHEDIRCWLLFRSAFQQSSIFGRAEILKDYPYRAEFPVCEDVDMFVRISRDHRVANLAETLIDRRIHSGQTIRSAIDPIADRQAAISSPLLRALGMVFSPEDLRNHVTLGKADAKPDAAFLDWAGDWLARLLTANARTRLFDQAALEFCVGFNWARAAANARSAKLLRSPLTRYLAGSHGRAWARSALPLMALASVRGSG